MATYPAALHTFIDTTGKSGVALSNQHIPTHTELAAELTAVQAALGVNPQGAEASVAAAIAALQAGGVIYRGEEWNYVKLSSAFTHNATSNLDTPLTFTPLPNKHYEFEVKLYMQSSVTTTGVRPGIKWPTAGIDQNVAWALSPTSATALASRFWGNTSTANAASTAVPVINEGLYGHVVGTFVTGAAVTGGFFITLASEIAASEVRFMENSFLRYREVDPALVQLGTAAVADTSDFASAAQGATADSATPLDEQVAAIHAALREDFARARGGSIGTNGKAAVALRFDHGHTNFKNIVEPLLYERELPSGLAVNTDPDKWTNPENSGASWADILNWSNDRGVEIWNHSHTHFDSTTDAALLANIVTDPMAVFGAELPNVVIEGFVVPGVSGTDWGGWSPTNTPAHFGSQYAAGRYVLANHAAVTGHMGGGIWGMTGDLVNGRRHLGMDSAANAAAITDVLKRAQSLQGGVQLFLHPSVIDTGGFITTATLTAILDWIVAERDAGRLEVLSMSGLMSADVRHAYRHNILQPFTDDVWTSAQLGNYTLTGGTYSSSTATAVLRQNVRFSEIEAVKGRVRELSVEARATGATAFLRLYTASTGTAGSAILLKNFTLPSDGVWRTYRIHPLMLKTAYSVNVDIGRVLGEGTLEMRNPRLTAI